MAGDKRAYANEKARPGERDEDADGVEDCQGLGDGTGRGRDDVPAKLLSWPRNRRMLPRMLRTKPTRRLRGGERAQEGQRRRGPADEAIEALCAGEAEEGERRVALEEVGVWDEVSGCFEVEPALGHGGRRRGGWRCRDRVWPTRQASKKSSARALPLVAAMDPQPTPHGNNSAPATPAIPATTPPVLPSSAADRQSALLSLLYPAATAVPAHPAIVAPHQQIPTPPASGQSPSNTSESQGKILLDQLMAG